MFTIGRRGGKLVEVCVGCGRFAERGVDVGHDWDCEVV